MDFHNLRQVKEFELERMQLSNDTDVVNISSADLEGQEMNRRVNLKDSVPKFDTRNANINLFFEIHRGKPKRESEQLKKRSIELFDHLIDSYDELNGATILAEKVDHFEADEMYVVSKVQRKYGSVSLSINSHLKA
ncbi:hypothetical protein NPIL_446161 [Nephila pilipes]|uniref:Uncharacterized protein n=1 Tax=Nephila pilipes TaxID=299642 RepID=A0A8X6P742_NEPPI|nr:hypothetical protein NPIL_446161 [Nephila pilipes]